MVLEAVVQLHYIGEEEEVGDILAAVVEGIVTQAPTLALARPAEAVAHGLMG